MWLAPKESEFTATSRIMLTAVRKKVDLKDAAGLGPKQVATSGSPSQKKAVIYPRISGKGPDLEDAISPEVQEVLKGAGGNRIMFVSLASNGVIIKRLDSAGSALVEERAGPVQGLGYWQPAIDAVVRRILNKESNPPFLLIKSFDDRNHPVMAQFLKERLGQKANSIANFCVY